MLRVIHIVESLDNSSGGPAVCVPLLVKYLNNNTIENYIFSIEQRSGEKNQIIDSNKNLNVIKTQIMGFKKIKFSLELKSEILKKINKDTIIHVHTLWNYPTYIGYKISKEYNIPLVVSIRGTMYPWALRQSKYIKKIAMLLFQRRMLEAADLIHVTAQSEVESLSAIDIVNDFALVPDGVEINKVHDETNKKILEKINYSKEKFYILFVGRIVKNKGIHYLLDYFIRNGKTHPNVEVLIMGEIEDKKYFDSLRVCDQVNFIGAMYGIEKHTIFSISSLFVLPSYSENFGISIAEAMVYKIPVITTTGTPWLTIKENNAGWVVDLSQENIDVAINDALQTDLIELRRMGKLGRNIVEDFSWFKQAQKMRSYYNQIKKG